MNLIDRDKLYNAICKPSDLPDDAINVCEIRLAIIDQSIVDAIPIEWIKRWCGNEPYWSNLALHLIDDWEKENERPNR